MPDKGMINVSQRQLLERAAKRLDESWQRDVLPLRVSRLLHKRIRPFLAKVDSDGYMVGQLWYQDHVLSSIRRMVDKGNDVVSIRQALIDIRQIADELTPEVLLDFHGRDPQWDEETNVSMSKEWVRITVMGARPDEPEAPISVIGFRTVQADLDRIREVGDRAHRLATLVTAHRLESKESVSVTDEEVEELLEAVSEIYGRWSLPLRAVDVDTDIDHFQVGYRMAEALQLYDHDEVSNAIREILEELDFEERVPPRSELIKDVHAHYTVHRT